MYVHISVFNRAMISERLMCGKMAKKRAKNIHINCFILVLQSEGDIIAGIAHYTTLSLMCTWPLILRELQILNKYSKNNLIPGKTIGQGVHKMSTKQARKLQATLVRNSAQRLSDSLTGVKCRATSVAKNHQQLKLMQRKTLWRRKKTSSDGNCGFWGKSLGPCQDGFWLII